GAGGAEDGHGQDPEGPAAAVLQNLLPQRAIAQESIEMAGCWFEELTSGRVFEHEIRRTVTEADNMWFSNATYNPARIQIDFEYCKGTEFGQPLVNSIFTLGLVIGLSVQDTTLGTTIANLGMTDVRFPKPVFHGDTLHALTTVKEARAS